VVLIWERIDFNGVTANSVPLLELTQPVVVRRHGHRKREPFRMRSSSCESSPYPANHRSSLARRTALKFSY
jgi:hypothetical protein